MRFRCWLLLVALLLVSQARAQRPESHVPLPRRADQPDLEKIFEQRFGQATALPDLLKQLEQLLPERSTEQLLKDLKNFDWSDPALVREMEELKKLLGQDNSNKLSKAQIDAIRKQFQDKFPSSMLPLGKNPRPPDGTGTKPPDPHKGLKPQVPDTEPGADPFEEETRADTQKFMEWLGKRLDRMSSNLADSPAVRRLATELKRITGGEGSGRGLGIDVQLARLSRSLRQLGDRLDPAWSSLQRLDMPSFSFGGFSGPSGGFVPSVGSGFWPRLGLLLAVVVLLLAAWKIGWQSKVRRAGAVPSWHPGPWPIDVDHIATRQELIQAFEYLSLLRLGLPARCWNHRAIAAQLGVSEGEVRLAAGRLAVLYERARYAPAFEPLPADAVVEARRDLRLLAAAA